jgi:hypothetical protein
MGDFTGFLGGLICKIPKAAASRIAGVMISRPIHRTEEKAATAAPRHGGRVAQSVQHPLHKTDGDPSRMDV